MNEGPRSESRLVLIGSRDKDINCMTDLKEVSPWKIALK